MNAEETEENERADFDKQLEKVVDVFLKFDPSSIESATIAFSDYFNNSDSIGVKTVALNLTNIRVMKKVERLDNVLSVALSQYDDAIRDQARSTVVLAGASFLKQPKVPPLGFLRQLNSIARMIGNGDVPEQEQRWNQIVEQYGYSATDELDEQIILGVERGYFAREALEGAATIVQDRIRLDRRDNTYSKAWQLYHRSLTIDDNTILDAMVAGAMENLTTITPGNMNAGVCFLRRFGRDTQASELVKLYIDANRDVPRFFSRQNRMFFNDEIDPELVAALDAENEAIKQARDPLDVLRTMASSNGYNPEDWKLFENFGAEELIRLFEQAEGEDVKGIMNSAKILADQEGAIAFREHLETAIARIATRSAMRADKLTRWGLFVENTVQ